MKVKLNDVRPGAVLFDGTSEPYVLDVEEANYDVVRAVRFEDADEVQVVTGRGTEHAKPDDPVVVTSKPPRVLMSWHEESETWAILVDTTNGSGRSKLNICLNDAELFDGCSDPERDEYGHTEADHEAAGACVRLVRTGSVGEPGVGSAERACPECRGTHGYHKLDCSRGRGRDLL